MRTSSFDRHLEHTLDLSFVRECVQETTTGRGRHSIDPTATVQLYGQLSCLLHHELPLFQMCHRRSQVSLTGFCVNARRIQAAMPQKISDIAERCPCYNECACK
jgi:hypothetical protein